MDKIAYALSSKLPLPYLHIKALEKKGNQEEFYLTAFLPKPECSVKGGKSLKSTILHKLNIEEINLQIRLAVN